MPDDLYERDALAWSEQQAALLRRVARGELVNDIDWAHVVEEIEDVGLTQLNAVHSYLRQMLFHLLKLHGWPHLTACHHWRTEIVAFQADAGQRFSPSMRQRTDLDKIYGLALRQVARVHLSDGLARSSPDACPVTLDQLLRAEPEDLEAAFQTASNH